MGGCFAVGSAKSSSLYSPAVYVDVNCDKSPNSLGYDQFFINFDRFGQLSLLDAIGVCNETTRKRYSIGSTFGGVMGHACFRKVVQDGWKINY